MLAKKLNVKTLLIVHTEELSIQAASKFKVVWSEVDIGIVKAGADDVSAQVVIASIQTAVRYKRLQILKEPGFELLIIDEAHHVADSSYASLVKELGFCNSDSNKLLVSIIVTSAVPACPEHAGDIKHIRGVACESIVEAYQLTGAGIKSYVVTLKGHSLGHC